MRSSGRSLRSSGRSLRFYEGLLRVSWGSPGGPLGLPNPSQLGSSDLVNHAIWRSISHGKYPGRRAFGRWHASKMRGKATKHRPCRQLFDERPLPHPPHEEPTCSPVTDVLAEVQETPSSDSWSHGAYVLARRSKVGAQSNSLRLGLESFTVLVATASQRICKAAPSLQTVQRRRSWIQRTVTKASDYAPTCEQHAQRS